MKEVRRTFLLVWIPIILIVNVAMYCNMGITINMPVEVRHGVSVYYEGPFATWIEFYLFVFFTIVVSIFLFVLVGLEEPQVSKK